MDPICHTLVGATIAQTRLRRHTAMSGAALIIGANIPDVDVVAYFWGETSALAFRRGWTHGVLAVLLWPAILTGLLLLWDRWRRRRAPDRPPVRPGALLAISALGVLTHPVLDTLNVYGVRWLMPFSQTWYYGDTLFILDPWLWLVLGVGWWVGARRHRRGHPAPDRPANVALALSAAYIVAMAVAGRVARADASRELRESGYSGRVLLASPEPLTPFRRGLLAGDGSDLRLGEFDLLSGQATWWPERYPLLDSQDDPRIEAAEADREAAQFLSWARFPTAEIRVGEAGRVWVDFLDLRYATAPGTFGAYSVGLAPPAPTYSEP